MAVGCVAVCVVVCVAVCDVVCDVVGLGVDCVAVCELAWGRVGWVSRAAQGTALQLSCSYNDLNCDI